MFDCKITSVFKLLVTEKVREGKKKKKKHIDFVKLPCDVFTVPEIEGVTPLTFLSK